MPTNKLTARLAAGVFATLGVCAANAAEPETAPFAQLASVSGEVLVDQGETLAPATSGMTLKPFDRVMVLDQGKATLVFRDGCRNELAGPAMRTIVATGNCSTENLLGPDAVALEQAAVSFMDGDERRLGLLLLGGAAVGGVIWAATDDDDDDDDGATAAAQVPAQESGVPIRLSP
jgi:hypothetical protein